MTTAFEGSARRLLIDGGWVETGEWIEVRSPYSAEVVGRVPKGSAEHARRAIDAAERALAQPLPAHKRAEILVRVAGGLARRHGELARTICDEAGKPLKAAKVEVSRAMSTFTFAAVETRRLAGETVPMDGAQAGEGKFAFTVRVPVGVVGAITPFNFPLNLVAHKVAPALAAGCPVVLKPATQTPLSALFLAELMLEAGLPAGWLNVVAGPSQEIGDVLVEDARVKLITFTGSAPVGWKLAERAPKKRVTLELGNSTPVIVAADADLDAAASKLAGSAFAFAGQSCISVQRIYVHESVFDPFLERFLAEVGSLVVGDPADESVDVGPVIDGEAQERILAWIDEARSAGARVAAGGETAGRCIQPTVLVDVDDGLRVSCEEVFGPVVVVNRFATLDEAIERANGTPFGLQAGVFTASLDVAIKAAQRLEFGGVLVNETPTFRSDQMPYGGTKESGNTREGPAWAVRSMTEERLVVIQL